ncbi:SprT family zinc-dependent metalloprotease [Helicobacter pylori]
MNAYCLTLNDTNIAIEKKDIKHLHISVCPPDGSVHVSCPIALNNESLRLSLIKRLPWIKEQQQNFLNQNRQSKRRMLERESHYLFGKRYLLKIEHTIKKHFVLQSPKYLILHVHQKTSLKNRLKVLENYYRQVLREKIQTYINQYEKILNESIQSFKIQKMKRIWGSCNATKRTLLFNLELIKAPSKGIEYVVVHELLHLKVRHHNEYFRDLLSLYLPNWQRARASLKETYLERS